MNAINIGSIKQLLPVNDTSSLAEQAWYGIGRVAVNAVKHLLFDLDVAYQAPIPRGAKLLCANHPTTIDPVMMTTLIPEQVSILISETLFKVPGLGRSLEAAGHIRVVTSQGRAALEAGIQHLEAGRAVGIFPEGAISQEDGGMARAHTGAARMAIASGAPVIPVGIAVKPENILRIKTMVDGVVETGTWYLRGPYAVTVGEPVYFSGDASDRAYVRQVTDAIVSRIACLSRESALRLQAKQPRRMFLPGRIRPGLYRLLPF